MRLAILFIMSVIAAMTVYITYIAIKYDPLDWDDELDDTEGEL